MITIEALRNLTPEQKIMAWDEMIKMCTPNEVSVTVNGAARVQDILLKGMLSSAFIASVFTMPKPKQAVNSPFDLTKVKA